MYSLVAPPTAALFQLLFNTLSYLFFFNTCLFFSDPKKLTNEKLVCTVCSKSLVADVLKGGQIFTHLFLQVLVCEVRFVSIFFLFTDLTTVYEC